MNSSIATLKSHWINAQSAVQTQESQNAVDLHAIETMLQSLATPAQTTADPSK